ncbi:MAG: right-handed parallel beta-helix repeat-containing protein [Casimicrobiaceae bacterium]
MASPSSPVLSGTVASRHLLVIAVFGSALLLVAASRPASADPLCRAEYWVSPKGSDAAAGDRARPLRTLERAREAVRNDFRRTRCDIVVNLRGGDYRLAQPLVLDWRDSGQNGHDVVYRAAPGERPVLSGAIPVQGWALHDAKLGIYRAFVGAQRTRHLFVNGTRAVRARTEANPDHFERTDTGFRFVKPGATMPVWNNAAEIEAVTITQWKMMRCPVQSIAGSDVALRDPCWKNANMFQAPPGQQPLWNFRLLSRFENAYEFLDAPGEWYLDAATGWLYYMPLPGENLAEAVVEMPVLEALIDGRGEMDKPVERIRFEGLTFAYATWLGPSTPDGYVADQSGFHLVGEGHAPNIIGHDEHTVRTPGNVRFRYAHRIQFIDNDFVHLGGVGLDFDTGSQHNAVIDNRFEDISSAGIQLGGVAKEDHHPDHPQQVTRDNEISNNLVRRIGRDYFDAAGIMVGFTTRSLISHNDISYTPWAGIAIGWGWGLLDPGTFLGLSGATVGMWGLYETPTTSRGNRILHNRIHHFLMELWDGGAIYSLGQQGTGADDGELIAGNVAYAKRPAAGGNIFYTDGGSRFVTLFENVSFDNPVGVSDFGPCGLPSELALCKLGIGAGCSSLPLCFLVVPYGSDIGGCIPHGDLNYLSNYWKSSAFYGICSTTYPVRVVYANNHIIGDIFDVPTRILRAAGRQRTLRTPN